MCLRLLWEHKRYGIYCNYCRIGASKNKKTYLTRLSDQLLDVRTSSSPSKLHKILLCPPDPPPRPVIDDPHQTVMKTVSPYVYVPSPLPDT